MSKLGNQSEIDKLAVTVGLDAKQLEFLAGIPPQELRSLRVAIYERLFDQDRLLFERLALAAVRLRPGAAARLAERSLGPLITARVAAELPPGPALAIAQRVSIGFFADVCSYLDPRRTRDLIVRLPIETIVRLAQELVRRGEHMTISRFVDFVTDEQTRAVVEAIDDEAALLRVAFYMGSKNRTDHLFRTLPHERIERMVRRVSEERDDLLPAFLSVLIHVSYALRRQLGDIIAAQDEPVLVAYVTAAQAQALWADILPVLAGMSAPARTKFVNLDALAEPAVQGSILETTDGHGLWGIVLPLIATMGDDNRESVSTIVGAMGEPALRRACEAALMGEQWETLLDLVRRMPAGKHRELADIVQALGTVDPELVARISRRADQLGLRYFTSDARTGVSASSAYS
jgi:hypothetical protein